ncbi:hypothetical protein [Streptomyces sp. NBC_01431]|uniref:hypothetical protein n=1 Tax=Streptomyces sp. NBC_01431 TaxID=2903863 RepID=UPI002E378CB2|nr:hypothetical protein [Streptomyces sp. NBC_01431]
MLRSITTGPDGPLTPPTHLDGYPAEVLGPDDHEGGRNDRLLGLIAHAAEPQ